MYMYNYVDERWTPSHVSALESQAEPLDIQTSSIALCLGPLHPCPYILFCMF